MGIFQLLYSYLWIHFAPEILSQKFARTLVAKVSKNELWTSCVHREYLLKSHPLVIGQIWLRQAGNVTSFSTQRLFLCAQKGVGS